MGKVRVKTIGIEETEKEEKKKAKARAEAKRIEAAKKLGQETKKEAAERQKVDTASIIVSEEKADKPISVKSVGEPKKKEKFIKKKKNSRSGAYTKVLELIDRNKKYSINEALELLPKLKLAKFDETVELHINTNEKGVSGNLTLPHGTGKKSKIEIADNTEDPKHLAELIKKIEAGNIDFDILIATPDSMTHLARVARFLGPRGLMPNPKNGTVHPKPKEQAKKFEGGQINFKTEAKAPIIHMTVGKVSFEEKQLNENIKAVLTAVQTKNIKSVTLKSTMSPGIKLTV